MENEFLRGFILGFIGMTGIYILIQSLIDNAFNRFFKSIKEVQDKEEKE